ncbi:hypothetical protein Pth03_51890 [Planotetraspora thailandica]|uniref:Uncharacterized protein n=1 Tax=Planotetraspora thailandica TaxID=487172 RepID=A0A8J3V697_9ACTN|nr:hypothetical protein Pth03_51890 [Planotetraspora thailandica]
MARGWAPRIVTTGPRVVVTAPRVVVTGPRIVTTGPPVAVIMQKFGGMPRDLGKRIS